MVAYFLHCIVALRGNHAWSGWCIAPRPREVLVIKYAAPAVPDASRAWAATVSNDQIHIRAIVNGAVGTGIWSARILYFLTQYPCAHRAGTHTARKPR